MMPEVNQLRSSMVQCLYILTSKTYYHFRMGNLQYAGNKNLLSKSSTRTNISSPFAYTLHMGYYRCI